MDIWLKTLLIFAVSLVFVALAGIFISAMYLIQGANIAIYALLLSVWVLLLGSIIFVLACFWLTKLYSCKENFGIKKIIVEKEAEQKNNQ